MDWLSSAVSQNPLRLYKDQMRPQQGLNLRHSVISSGVNQVLMQPSSHLHVAIVCSGYEVARGELAMQPDAKETLNKPV